MNLASLPRRVVVLLFLLQDLAPSRHVIEDLTKDDLCNPLASCLVQPVAHTSNQEARVEPQAGGVCPHLPAECHSPWMYTEKECLTESELNVLLRVKTYLAQNGINVMSNGTIQDSLAYLHGGTLLVFAFYPTPQLLRGSCDAWLHELVAQATQAGQAMCLIVVHSEQFLQRLQLDPVLLLEKGIIAEVPFPVTNAHRFEQVLNKNQKARLYKKAGSKVGSPGGSSSGLGLVVFKNVHAVQLPEDWQSLLGNAASKVAFFGEGAGLGMLSVSSLVNASEVKAQCTKGLLQSLTTKLQAERVHSCTSKVSWADALPQLNSHTTADTNLWSNHMLLAADDKAATGVKHQLAGLVEPCAKRAKVQ